MVRPAAKTGLIHTKPGRRPKQQGWLHQGLVAGGQRVAELWLKVFWMYPVKEKVLEGEALLGGIEF